MVSFIQCQSHFSFNPFLLYHPNIQTQSGPNLQSLYWLAQNPNYVPDFPSTFAENPNFLFVPNSNQIFAQNFSLNTFHQYLPQNQLITFQQISNNNITQLQMIQKEFGQEKNAGTSEVKQQDMKFLGKQSEERNFKKKRGKKLSKKEKKQKQILRNSIQNSKRNIIPNQIHQILSILFKRGKSSHLVQKMIMRQVLNTPSSQFSVNRFYLYQSLLKQKINHYANENSLRHLLSHLDENCSIYSQQEQQTYMKIGLILVFHFIRNDANLMILNSQRIKSSNRLQHMTTKRYLQKFLKNLILDQQQQKNLS